ncbi:MAG: hypothetical protein RQ739_13705 [Desulfotignum sp.]|nr:hypothetical protein [Desulfotignum sp.]
MQHRFCSLAVTVLVLGFLALSDQGLAQESPDACLLFTQADASGLLQESVSPGVARARITPAGSSCRYSYTKNGGVFGVSLSHCTDASIAEEGIHESAADVMARQLRAMKNSSYASTLLKIIPDMGDEAFWNGRDLWMRKGGHLVIIKPTPQLEGSFANMDAADAAMDERSRELAVQVGEIILPRLP